MGTSIDLYPRSKPSRVFTIRLRRWLFNLLVGVSLLLFVATIVLWVRSYGIGDGLSYVESNFDQAIAANLRNSGNGLPRVPLLMRNIQVKTGSGKVYAYSYYRRVERSLGSTLGNGWPDATALGFHRTDGVDWRFFGLSNPTLDWHRLGCDIERAGFTQKGFLVKERLIAIPLAFFAIAATIIPLIWIRARVSAKRRLAGKFCINCGYDLRATPDRCPECGTAVDPA